METVSSSESASPVAAVKRPLIWALQTHRVGDNAQVIEVCKQLGGDTVVKQLVHNSLHILPNYVLGSSLLSLTRESAGTLVPPWPDAVVAVGRRTVSAARWIKEASGGKTKMIHLGRPRAPLADFDLIVTTPQYGLPKLPNVIEVMLPFSVPKRVAQAEHDLWSKQWSDLPRPLIAVVVGGSKYPLRMGEQEHRKLGQGVIELARRKGGSLLIMMSPRSHASAAKWITESADVPLRVYPWGPGQPNPYHAALEIADEFVVTSDSASMVSETLSTEKPVSLFRLPKAFLRLSWSAQRGLGSYLARNGVLQPPRNVSRLSSILLQHGLVSELGEERHPVKQLHRADEIAIRRMKKLLGRS